jgi:membrane-bound acyltransferase YfiQ involved in biofilm formation
LSDTKNDSQVFLDQFSPNFIVIVMDYFELTNLLKYQAKLTFDGQVVTADEFLVVQ